MARLTPVARPVYVVTYQGADITRDLAPMLLSLTYTDKLHGESDELELTIEDQDGRWRRAWYPSKGELIEAEIGFDGHSRLECGQFRVDEIELQGPPDTLHLRALAAAITRSLRTANSRAFEGKTLRGIAETIAQEHGLTVVGDLPGITVERITQSGKEDLAFLTRLAEEHGFVFSVRGDQMRPSRTRPRKPSRTAAGARRAATR